MLDSIRAWSTPTPGEEQGVLLAGEQGDGGASMPPLQLRLSSTTCCCCAADSQMKPVAETGCRLPLPWAAPSRRDGEAAMTAAARDMSVENRGREETHKR